MRIRRKHIIYSLFTLGAALLFNLLSCTQALNAQTANPVEAGFFSKIEAPLLDQTTIPVYLPQQVAPSVPDQKLYPEIIEAVQSAYSVAYGRVPDCTNATFCRVGWIEGYQVGVYTPTNESIAELIAMREGHLETATRRSEDEIEQVTLIDGTEAIVLPWIGYAHPGPTEVIFEKNGDRYIFSIVMAQNDDVVELANTALRAGAR